MSYQLQKPGKGRVSFAIYEKRRDGTKPVYVKLKNLELDALNKQLKSGSLGVLEVERLARRIIEDLYKKRDVGKPAELFTADNQKIVNDFWEIDYQYRDLVDPQSARDDFDRAVEVLGHVPLRVAPKDEMLKQISSKVQGKPKLQRRVVARLNTLLKFLQRDFKLPRVKRPGYKIAHLNLEQFRSVIPFLKDENIKCLCAFAFATGCRFGECLAIYRVTEGRFVYVESQVRRDNKLGDTKTRRTRRAPIIKELLPECERFVKLTKEERECLSRGNISAMLKLACQKAKVPQIRFHDLRHSYAIYLLSRGVSISLAAQSLGNSVQVCQEYYAGFELSNETLDIVSGKL